MIIAGFHRSGTSLTAQLLHRAGLFLGYEMLSADKSNPYGHFEDVEVMKLHRQILADNGMDWRVTEPFVPTIAPSLWKGMHQVVERRNTENKLWGFKDPRACLFLMLWKYLLPDAKVLLVYRNYSDSTYSLGRRHSTQLFSESGPQHLHRKFWQEPDLALRMWLAHNELLLTFAHTYPKNTLAISLDMIQSGFPLVWALNERWSLGLEDIPVSEVFDMNVTYRSVNKQPVSDKRLIERVEDTWEALEQLSKETERMLDKGVKTRK